MSPQQPTANLQQPTAKSQPPTANRQHAKSQQAMTMLELVVAMLVTGALLVVVLAAYGGVFKRFSWNTRRAADIQEMVLTRVRLSQAFATIGTVVSHRNDAIEYREEGSDSLRTLALKDHALYRGDEPMVEGLRSLELHFREKRSVDGRSMLRWEASLPGNRRVGGAVAVRVE